MKTRAVDEAQGVVGDNQWLVDKGAVTGAGTKDWDEGRDWAGARSGSGMWRGDLDEKKRL